MQGLGLAQAQGPGKNGIRAVFRRGIALLVGVGVGLVEREVKGVWGAGGRRRMGNVLLLV
jgi:hypothetical protein